MARKNLSLTEKLAGTLLRVKNSNGSWLIPEPLRSTGTAQEVYKAVQFDHNVLDAFEDDKVWSNRPQNIYPMLTLEHRKKSILDNRNAKKTARILKKQVAAAARQEEKTLAARRKLLNTAQTVAADQIKRRKKPKYDWKKGRYKHTGGESL